MTARAGLSMTTPQLALLRKRSLHCRGRLSGLFGGAMRCEKREGGKSAALWGFPGVHLNPAGERKSQRRKSEFGRLSTFGDFAIRGWEKGRRARRLWEMSECEVGRGE